MATATIQNVKGISKIREGAKNHHIGLRKYAEKRLPKIEEMLKTSKAPNMREWLLGYRRKLKAILAAS